MIFLAFPFSRTLNKLTDKLFGWIDLVVLKTPNIVLGVIVLTAFVLLSKIIAKGVEKVAEGFIEKANLKFLIVKAIRILIQILGVVVTLNVVGLDKTVTSLLAGAGIIGLALSFAFQNIATNFISGILISFRHTYEVGDWIMTQKIQGLVREITIYHTVIITDTGQHVTVPNKEILETPLHNFTKDGIREIELQIAVSYNEDLDRVMEVTEKALLKTPSLLKEKDHRLYYKKFADFSVNLEVSFWINFKQQRDFDQGMSEAIMNIKRAYDTNGIVIPFPIKTVKLENGREW